MYYNSTQQHRQLCILATVHAHIELSQLASCRYTVDIADHVNGVWSIHNAVETIAESNISGWLRRTLLVLGESSFAGLALHLRCTAVDTDCTRAKSSALSRPGFFKLFNCEYCRVIGLTAWMKSCHTFP